jgi:hypothetical protein
MVHLTFYCSNFTSIEYQPEIRGARNFFKFNITHLQNFGQPEEAEDDENLKSIFPPDMSHISQKNNNINPNKNPRGGLYAPYIRNPQQFTGHNSQEVYNKNSDITNSSNVNSHLSRLSLMQSNCIHNMPSFSRNDIESTSRQKEKEKEKEEESSRNTNTLRVKQRTEIGFITSKRSSLNAEVDGEGLEDKDNSMSSQTRFKSIPGRRHSLSSFGSNNRVLNIIANTLYRQKMCLSLRKRASDSEIILKYPALSSLMVLSRRNGMYSLCCITNSH